jgi:hypothetical protein
MVSLVLLFPLLGFLVNGLAYVLFQTRKDAKPAGAVWTGQIGRAHV